jgi:hypothetical protein
MLFFGKLYGTYIFNYIDILIRELYLYLYINTMAYFYFVIYMGQYFFIRYKPKNLYIY